MPLLGKFPFVAHHGLQKRMFGQRDPVARLERIKHDHLDEYHSAFHELLRQFLVLNDVQRHVELSHIGGDCMFVSLGKLTGASPTLVRAIVMAEAHFSYDLDVSGGMFQTACCCIFAPVIFEYHAMLIRRYNTGAAIAMLRAR